MTLKGYFKWIGGMAVFALLLAGCSVDKSPTLPKAPAPDVSLQVVSEYAPPLANATLKLSANALTSYESLKQATPNAPGSVNGNAGTTDEEYFWDNGFHIWKGNLTIPGWEDIWQMDYIRKIQFRSAVDGNVLFASDNADYMYAFTQVNGQFGFGRGYPETGEIFQQFIEGEWTGLISDVPTFNATGYYIKNWKGYYNGELTEVEIRVDYKIKNLKFIKDANAGYLLDGKIVATLPPYKFYAKFNGTNKGTIAIYQFGIKIGEQTFEVPNLYGWDIKTGFIPTPNTSWLNTLTNPTALLSGFAPISQ